ncbi:hypothetical protein [Streptomyces sp. NPDC052107]
MPTLSLAARGPIDVHTPRVETRTLIPGTPIRGNGSPTDGFSQAA